MQPTPTPIVEPYRESHVVRIWLVTMLKLIEHDTYRKGHGGGWAPAFFCIWSHYKTEQTLYDQSKG